MSHSRIIVTAAILIASVGGTSAQAQDNESAAERRAELGESDRRPASEEGRFGLKSQLAFSTDAALSIERRTQSGTKATTTLSILPAMDYFVIDNLSVGGLMGVTYQKAGDERATSFRVGPRIGYNVPLSRLFSIWPKVGFAYAYNKVKVSEPDTASGADRYTTRDNHALALNLFAPVMLHPAPHFFAGFGPFLDTDLNGKNRATTWGFRLTIGGWI